MADIVAHAVVFADCMKTFRFRLGLIKPKDRDNLVT
jgi:hypothetical protein